MKTRSAIISKEDVPILDFIWNTITAYDNCDTWGSCDMFEKNEMCEKARVFLSKYIKVEE